MELLQTILMSALLLAEEIMESILVIVATYVVHQCLLLN